MPASEYEFSYIVGLGNPGEEYEATYHNVGFLALDSFCENERPDWRRSSSGRFLYRTEGPYTFIKPLTYMNLSGSAVSEALRYFSAGKASLLVIHDDIDLPIGAHRFSLGRGHAGHRGVASIIETLGDRDFARVRIGIAPMEGSDAKRVKAEDLVLRPIRKEHAEALFTAFADIKKTYLPLLGH